MPTGETIGGVVCSSSLRTDVLRRGAWARLSDRRWLLLSTHIRHHTVRLAQVSNLSPRPSGDNIMQVPAGSPAISKPCGAAVYDCKRIPQGCKPSPVVEEPTGDETPENVMRD